MKNLTLLLATLVVCSSCYLPTRRSQAFPPGGGEWIAAPMLEGATRILVFPLWSESGNKLVGPARAISMSQFAQLDSKIKGRVTWKCVDHLFGHEFPTKPEPLGLVLIADNGKIFHYTYLAGVGHWTRARFAEMGPAFEQALRAVVNQENTGPEKMKLLFGFNRAKVSFRLGARSTAKAFLERLAFAGDDLWKKP